MPVDARSDLYSLGVIGYELLAERHPYPQATVADYATAAKQTRPAALRQLAPQLPASIAELMDFAAGEAALTPAQLGRRSHRPTARGRTFCLAILGRSVIRDAGSERPHARMNLRKDQFLTIIVVCYN